jgi:two-component system invasion response regulator UvrY
MQNRGGNIQAVMVLIVDDHPVVRDGYRRLLESTGEIRVIAEAGTGEDGYERYKDNRPDVVIMDLIMPGAGGLDAIRRITQWDPEARILAFSMHENPIFQKMAGEAGAIGYVTKRAAPHILVESVREVAKGNDYFPTGEHSGLTAPSADERAALERLTLREFEVFNLLALGHPVTDIAKMLNISQNTAGVHQTRIMNKLCLQNGAQLVRLAIRHGVVEA